MLLNTHSTQHATAPCAPDAAAPHQPLEQQETVHATGSTGLVLPHAYM